MLGHCLVEGEELSSLMALAGQWLEERSPLSGSSSMSSRLTWVIWDPVSNSVGEFIGVSSLPAKGQGEGSWGAGKDD
jgi:hypothetical protein